ncbi:MAG: hypothetical protein A2888_02600 [Chlamydiae bacterium RIFCSPLOWO2_01_FULL_28_7]|nr:MAG: hypothetical protein A2888_02600 [Chlamydiae bacterium RIFCSPLOWO2_01_FULL_28_7]
MFTIYSIIPSLENKIGHFFEYNRAFSEAAKINQWKCIKIIPKDCEIGLLSSDWVKKLYKMDPQKKLKNLRNFLPFFKIIKKLKKEKKPVLFMEDFNIQTLILVFICVLLLRPKIKFWLLHRFEYDVMILKGKISLFFSYLIEFCIGKNNMTYMTDSTLIAKRNGYLFKRKFYVLPIPHTEFMNNNRSRKKEILLWWPGGLIREEKGLSTIIELSNLLKNSNLPIKLIIAENSKDKININDKIHLVSSFLTREEYYTLMSKADLILLPYQKQNYRYRTSGIFVEAIVAGAIPITSNNTWMATELSKYNLEELIINWDNKNLLDILMKIHISNTIEEKIKKMKTDYKDFHNIKNFAKILKKISRL